MEKLFELTAPSSSWAAAQAFGFGARSVHVRNRGAVPVRVRWGDAGDAIARVEAIGEGGSVRLFTYQPTQRPTAVAVFGVGGTADVIIEASEEERQADTALTVSTGGGSGSGSGTIGATTTSALQLVELPLVAAASTTSVHAGLQANASNNSFSAPIFNPITPRSLSVTFGSSWDGGAVTITGTDQYDNAVTDVVASMPGGTLEGQKIFKTVTSIEKSTIGASSDIASVGTGNKLGIVAGTAAGALVGPIIVLGASMVDPFPVVDSLVDGFTPANPPSGTTYQVLFTRSQAHSHTLS